MWRWLRKRLPERFRFISSLWGISCGVHILLLLVLLKLTSFSERHNLVVSKASMHNDARIVLLPMFKTVKNTAVASTTHNALKKSKPKQTQSKKIPAPKKVTPVEKVTPQKKVSKTTMGSVSANPPSPKGIRRDLGASADAKAMADKTSDKTSDRKNKKSESKQLKKTNKTLVQKKAPVQQLAKNKTETKPAGKPEEQIIYVGRDDLRAMQVQSVVSEALQKNWRPPSGLSDDTVCHITFDIGSDGKACNVRMQQGSSVLIFDVAARSAVMHAQFNPQAKGKQFTVAFKP